MKVTLLAPMIKDGKMVPRGSTVDIEDDELREKLLKRGLAVGEPQPEKRTKEQVPGVEK